MANKVGAANRSQPSEPGVRSNISGGWLPSLTFSLGRMKSPQLTKVFHVMGAASVLITSGCATVFVRSKSTVDPEHVFPVTTFDTQFFWNAGVKGEPLFATVEPNQKNNPVARFGIRSWRHHRLTILHRIRHHFTSC